MTHEQQDSLVSVEETRRVEQFLLREARLLDGECWDAWLHALSEDIHYWMPGIENRRREDKSGPYCLEHMAFFDDGMRELKRRVARFKQPSAWAENPPTRNAPGQQHEVYAGPAPGEYLAYSCFINVRSRGRTSITRSPAGARMCCAWKPTASVAQAQDSDP
jgi:ethylbenzene dioxygenase beta subunit